MSGGIARCDSWQGALLISGRMLNILQCTAQPHKELLAPSVSSAGLRNLDLSAP